MSETYRQLSEQKGLPRVYRSETIESYPTDLTYLKIAAPLGQALAGFVSVLHQVRACLKQTAPSVCSVARSGPTY